MIKHKLHSQKWYRVKEIIRKILGNNLRNGKYWILKEYVKKNDKRRMADISSIRR